MIEVIFAGEHNNVEREREYLAIRGIYCDQCSTDYPNYGVSR